MTTFHAYPLTMTASTRGSVASLDGAGRSVLPVDPDVADLTSQDGAGSYVSMLSDTDPSGTQLGSALGDATQIRLDLAGQEAIPDGEVPYLVYASWQARLVLDASSENASGQLLAQFYDGATPMAGVYSEIGVDDGADAGQSPPFEVHEAVDPGSDMEPGAVGFANATRSVDLNLVMQNDAGLRQIAGLGDRYRRHWFDLSWLALWMVTYEEPTARWPLRQRRRKWLAQRQRFG